MAGKIIARLVGVVCLLSTSTIAFAQRSFDHDILAETFGFDESTKKSIALEDLKQGCSQRDCIPSIDDPKYVAAEDASHIADDDVVIALSWKGEQRAYLAWFTFHPQTELVN